MFSIMPGRAHICAYLLTYLLIYLFSSAPTTSCWRIAGSFSSAPTTSCWRIAGVIKIMKNHEKSSVFSAVHRNVAAHKGAVHKDSQNALEDARFSATEPQIKKNFRCAAIWLGGRPPQTPPEGFYVTMHIKRE